MFSQSRINPIYSANLIFLHGAALAALLFPFHASYLGWMVFHYLWFGFASSLYYHRGLAHRGYRMVEPLQIFLLLGGLIGLSGDPISWVAIHRYHHQHADLDSDVHSPKEGAAYAYFGWCMRLDGGWVDTLRSSVPDLRAVWYLRWSEGQWVSALFHFAYVAVGWRLFGLGAVLWAVYVPLALSYQFCWMLIAWLGHSPRAGRRSFETEDLSTNLRWLGLPTLGEAFHNNHHDCPPRARAGLSWREPDPSAWLLWTLEKMGLVRDVIWDRKTRA